MRSNLPTKINTSKYPRPKFRIELEQEGYFRLILRKIHRSFFWFFLLVFVITYFTQNNYKDIEIIEADSLNEPIQSKLNNEKPIEFIKDGYSYKLTPTHNYQISGLVVNRFDYTKISLRKSDAIFPLDLCIIWGENLANNVFKEPSLRFRQDARFCWAMWTKKIDFNMNKISNNHLVINNDYILNQTFDINEGDQVKITGKLVNAEIKNVDGKIEKYDFSETKMKSSTNREDDGAGACEIIYVEKIEILQKGNPVSFYLHKISLYLIIIYIILKTLTFTFSLLKSDN